MGVQACEKQKHENLEALLREYCETRDINLRNKLLKEYLYIAEIIAKKFVNRGVEYDDLFQIASLALLKALERYDINKGFKFSSFATPTIIGEIKNYFRDKSRIIRLPRKESEMIKKLEKARQQLTNKFGRSPKPEEIAEYLNISTEEVLELMESRYITSTISLDYYIDDGETDLSMLIGEEEKDYTRIENKDLIEKAMEKLNDLERKVIYERFFNERSQRDIAEEIGVSQMYISRLERRVLQRLKRIFSEN